MSTNIRPGTSERVPFDILIGDWIGVGTVFLPNGAYYSHVTSRVWVHEHFEGEQRIIRYINNSGGDTHLLGHGEVVPTDAQANDLHPMAANLVDQICHCRYVIDFIPDGKRVIAIEDRLPSSILSANGFMSTNDNYTFIVRNTFVHNGETRVLKLHNNHYMSSSNTRHVIGNISDEDGRTVLLTSFTYTSYTPPGGDHEQE